MSSLRYTRVVIFITSRWRRGGENILQDASLLLNFKNCTKGGKGESSKPSMEGDLRRKYKHCGRDGSSFWHSSRVIHRCQGRNALLTSCILFFILLSLVPAIGSCARSILQSLPSACCFSRSFAYSFQLSTLTRLPLSRNEKKISNFSLVSRLTRVAVWFCAEREANSISVQRCPTGDTITTP